MMLAIVAGIMSFLFLNYGNFINSFLRPPEENINVLILGKGGMGHEAPDLTDTVIFASVSDKKIALVSLPRDIWVPEIRAKLNSAYFYGKLPLAKSTAEKVVGVPVDYGLIIDFSGFKEIIDVLGGIEVDVQNSFTDEKYPVAGRENDLCEGDKTYACRYETISFQEGKQMMDGETALKFVRSRNAEGDEGTDFAREARQQLVISAIKNKVLSLEVFLNPGKIKSLWKVMMKSIETDIPQEVLGGLSRKTFDARGSVDSVVIPEGMLTNPPVSARYDNQYVLIPVAGDWSEIQKWVETIR